MRIIVHDQPIILSEHAIDRYHERVKPGLDRGQALTDLVRLLRHHAQIVPAPPWSTVDPETQRCVLIGDSIAFPLARGHHAATCVVKGMFGDVYRQARNTNRKRAPLASGRARRKALDRDHRRDWREAA